jgi:Ca2+-binding RTX toxin-like protein
MGETCPIIRPGTARRFMLLGLLSLLALCVQLLLAGRAEAVAFTGGVSPTIVSGLADLNGDGVANGRDDANEFYGATHIIDGGLDCDAWGATANAGSAGNGAIDGSDNCSLVGYDGTPDGVTIEVLAGVFQVANGPLPTVFNALNPANPDIGDSQFAWSAIDGRVDSNGNEAIGGDDCHFGLIGKTTDVGLGDATDGTDILGNPGANECGFANPPNTADNGLVDLNDDADITASDSCSNGCFFGHDVVLGKVQELPVPTPVCPGFEGDPRNQVVGTPGADTLTGTGGRDIICGLGRNDTLIGLGGKDLLLGGGGADVLRGGVGRDVLRGGNGNDRLFGGDGNDRLSGNGGKDLLRGGGGADLLLGGGGADVLRGGVGRDVLRGGNGNDRLFGGDANDRLFGNRGNDHLDGGAGFDRAFGGPGRDTFVRCELGRQ